MTKQQVIDEIKNNNDLEESFKSHWIARIESEGLTKDVLDDLQDALQQEVEKHFTAMGVSVDENDPEFKAHLKEMTEEIEAAQQEFNSTMQDLEHQAADLQNATAKQLDDIDAQAIKDSI